MRYVILILMLSTFAFSQSTSLPPIETGVSHALAQWRAARYSDVRYKLNLTLEKMSPVLKGTIEIRVKVSEPPASAGGQSGGGLIPPIVLDWRRIAGHEQQSTISNVFVNGKSVSLSANWPPANAGGSDFSDHLIFRDGVVAGENVIKLDFTSPILTSGSAITRYVDKEDGAEYIYSLFVPSDASTAFPVFDQPDLKARFALTVIIGGGRSHPDDWKVVSNMANSETFDSTWSAGWIFPETKPISTYVFAFAAGPWEKVSNKSEPPALAGGQKAGADSTNWPPANAGGSDIYVRKSQAAKFKPHAAEVFRLKTEAVKYLETYFDYKFPFPKYDIVLIPEFPFGGMEHAGATFLRESSVIFPTEPTKGDYISRANLIFHETAHQWFGDTVTMRWFDDLWLKEGFAEFMAYKTLEHVAGGNPTGREGVDRTTDTGQMPQVNAWKVFYERNKQAAYATDSTRGTTPIYQPIDNLSSAKSAYGNIVYRKAPSFLRQAEFYLGEDKFQTAVRAFLKKHEFANAGWEDLVGEFSAAQLSAWKNSDDFKNERDDVNRSEEVRRRQQLEDWARFWVTQMGVRTVRVVRGYDLSPQEWDEATARTQGPRAMALKVLKLYSEQPGFFWDVDNIVVYADSSTPLYDKGRPSRHGPIRDSEFYFPNYQDYGYGIFLLDDKSRDYVLKNIQNEKDPFLRSMMWGALWDSVREGEMDPREYVELAVKQLGGTALQKPARSKGTRSDESTSETDETIVASILGRVSTAMNYYMSEPPALAGGQKVGHSSTNGPPAHAGGSDLRTRLEAVLIDRMQHAATPGERITFYRAFVSNASTDKARGVLKEMLTAETQRRGDARGANPSGGESVSVVRSAQGKNTLPTGRVSASGATIPLKAKDKFDIVTRLIILGDPDAPRLLTDLEKTETGDDAKRYAYAAHAAFATADNRAKFWNDFVGNKDISESWIEAAMVPFNTIRHDELSLPYLQRALAELPNLKRTRKIFFVNGWLAAFIGGQRDEKALAIINQFLADNPNLDKDLRLKILENSDLIERSVRIRTKWAARK